MGRRQSSATGCAERLDLLDDGRHEANGWLDDQIAIKVRGRALIYTIGAYLDGEPLQKLMDRVSSKWPA